MKDLLSREYYCCKMHTPLMETSLPTFCRHPILIISPFLQEILILRSMIFENLLFPKKSGSSNYVVPDVFNYYSIMVSMNYFGQVVLEILENDQLKSNFENSEIEVLSPFLVISLRNKTNLVKSCIFLKFIIYISREPVLLESQRDYFEILSLIRTFFYGRTGLPCHF